jgi:hypothetical protein
MTASETEALTARWRRLEHGLDEVRAAVNSPDPHRCPDAVARALCALYDLWEFWSSHANHPPGKKWKAEDAAVCGDDDGETTAALVHARGSLTHVHAEFGAFTDTVAATVLSHFGCWRWQDHPDQRFPQRDAWYATHVKDREVLPPLEAAARWLRARPELTVP